MEKLGYKIALVVIVTLVKWYPLPKGGSRDEERLIHMRLGFLVSNFFFVIFDTCHSVYKILAMLNTYLPLIDPDHESHI